MYKNLLLLISLLTLILINFNNLSAETISVIPLKKPILSNDEISKKLSKNILKPLKKPKKIKEIPLDKKKITKIAKVDKISFKIP